MASLIMPTNAWDTSKPDGTPKQLLEVSRLAVLGWWARIPFVEALVSTVADFASQGSRRL